MTNSNTNKMEIKMKKLSIILLFGITLPFSFSAEGQESEFDPNELKAEYFQNEEVKDDLLFNDKKGNSYKVNKSDNRRGVYIKKDDEWLKHGAFFNLSEGRVTRKTTYSYGKKHGPYEAYHDNGKIKFQYSYQNDLKEGKWYHYRENGNIYEECEYKNGKKEGTQITYRKNGEKMFVTTYVNDEKHGESLHYNPKGKLVARTQYKAGKQVGEKQWYD